MSQEPSDAITRMLPGGIQIQLPADHYLAHATDADWAALMETAFVCEVCGRLVMTIALDPPDVDPEDMTEDCTHIMPSAKVEAKIGRNDPCPCGSGAKWKRCHGTKVS